MSDGFYVDYTVVPSWFGGDVQARDAVMELGREAARRMRCEYRVLAIEDTVSFRFGRCWIARIKFLPSMW